ncbi:hypothetical protein FN846DRAFT_970962 [Sphaerosporella brunnea]|uniref:Peptidase S54 rhomboid domain-containing protein n=1 Tax=Sphaerosporella brunnea TaxID=1250544 RepID=A0A5J5EHF3_9PEZI|nr:hypothetical protein FN846DRAFT_970962 [Sphaerosporella brunnea]
MYKFTSSSSFDLSSTYGDRADVHGDQTITGCTLPATPPHKLLPGSRVHGGTIPSPCDGSSHPTRYPPPPPPTFLHTLDMLRTTLLLPRTVTTPLLARGLLLRQKPPPCPRAPTQFLRHYARPRSPKASKHKQAENAVSDPDTIGPTLRERVWAAGRLSELQAPPHMSAAARLLPSALFSLLVIGGSLYYASTWTPPAPSDRLFPTVPLAFSTVACIIGINAGVFLAWKTPLPPIWRVLNRYFISVPALPHAAAMLGAAFSHQTPTHLAVNMAVLYVFGTSLCEQVGAGPFLALYLSGGVASSFASLAYNVLAQRFGVVSLGASGAIAALIGAYAVLNPDARMYVIFLPFVALKARTFATGLALMEVVGIVRGWKVVDHVAHLGGMAWGAAGGWVIVEEYKRRLERRRKAEEEEQRERSGWWWR